MGTKILSTIIFVLFCFAAQAQYISTNGVIILYSGATEQYDTPDITVSGCYDVRSQEWVVSIKLFKAGITVDPAREYHYRYTKTDIDAYTGTGTGDTAKIQNALSQAVAATLLVLNPTRTFTQH